MNLRMKTKNHEADQEKGFLIKSIFKPYGRAKAMPQAWELRSKNYAIKNKNRILWCKKFEKERVEKKIF